MTKSQVKTDFNPSHAWVRGRFRRSTPGIIARMKSGRMYRVLFSCEGEIYQLCARSVGSSGLWGFIEVSEPVFGIQSTVVVDPSEEKLKARFEGVERFHIPMHAVQRIDEVRELGPAAIRKPAESKVSPFPVYTQPPVKG